MTIVSPRRNPRPSFEAPRPNLRQPFNLSADRGTIGAVLIIQGLQVHYRKLFALLAAGLFLAGFCAFIAVIVIDHEPRANGAAKRAPYPLAVLGDSDSHSYHDSLSYEKRGGRFAATTFNWPEALARLRPDQLDLGDWGIWGPRRPIALAREVLGLKVRRPRKEDYRYNFAITGAHCGDLLSGWRQTQRLLAVMDEEPERWRQGIVVVRIGVNSFGGKANLRQMASDPAAQQPRDAISQCVGAIRDSIAAIRLRQPQTRFVLVGIFNNVHWAKYLHDWQSPAELANIDAVLDVFDDALRDMAAKDARIAFADDRMWFERHWGGRDENGKPAYHDVVFGNGTRVHNTSGDDPVNSVLEDGHAGTLWNGMWVQNLIDVLNGKFGLNLRPVQEDEILNLLATPNTAPAANP